MTTDPKRTHYKMLMLAEIADEEIIRTVYRKLAQRYHPDIDPSPEARARMARDQRGLRRRCATREKRARVRRSGWPAAATGARTTADRSPGRGRVWRGGRAGWARRRAASSTSVAIAGWTLGQIKRHDPEFLEWLLRVPAGRNLRDEISRMTGRKSA